MSVGNELAVGIGEIMLNLLSLEFLLRLFLYEAVGPKDPHFDLDGLSVGDDARATPLTNFDSLGTLMKKVNGQLASRGLADRIDVSLVQVRDALAHGRITSLNPAGPFKLVKFSKPSPGRVEVTDAHKLSRKWLTSHTERTGAEIKKVMRLGQSLRLSGFLEQ